jgi:hypothetical protein
VVQRGQGEGGKGMKLILGLVTLAIILSLVALVQDSGFATLAW